MGSRRHVFRPDRRETLHDALNDLVLNETVDHVKAGLFSTNGDRVVDYIKVRIYIQ